MSIDTPAPVRVEAAAPPSVRAADRTRHLSLARVDVLLMLALFVMAIIPRAAWVAYADRVPQGLNDPTLYMISGDLLADGAGYTRFTGEPTAYYPVGYPAALGALKKGGDVFGWGRSVFSAKMMNGVFGAITVVLLYLLAARVVDRRLGFWSGALLAIFPSQVFYTGAILSEAQFTMLLIAAVLILLWHPWERDGMSWQRLFAFGVVLGAATMTRAITLALPFLLLAIWWFYLRSRKRAVIQALIVIAGVAVLAAPWSIRNSVRLHTVVGTSTNLGDDLCIGNFDGATGAFLLHGKCFEGVEGLTPQQVEVKRNREGVRTAIHDVLHDPVRMPKLVAMKAYWTFYKDDDGLWATESYGYDWFIWHPLREILSFSANSIYYAAGLLAILGAAAFAFSKDIRRAVIVLIGLYVLLLPLVFFGDPRFHFPGIPFVVIVAVATVIGLWDRRHRALLELRP